MATTTLEAIRVALEKTIVVIVPSGAVPGFSSRSYVLKGKRSEWSDVALSDVDRRFSIALVPGSDPQSFGGLSEHEASAELVITIGHEKGDDLSKAASRRAMDVRQLSLEMQDPANYPTSVWRIGDVSNRVSTDAPEFWLTQITFTVTYSETSVG